MLCVKILAVSLDDLGLVFCFAQSCYASRTFFFFFFFFDKVLQIVYLNLSRRFMFYIPVPRISVFK